MRDADRTFALKMSVLLPVIAFLVWFSWFWAPAQAQQGTGALYPTGPDTPVTCYVAASASTNSTICKASQGNVYHYRLSNTTATIYYLRMYNLAVAPTCSSATGFVESIPIPASTSGAGRSDGQPNGQSLTAVATASTSASTAAGIGFCITGGAANTDNTNAATGVFVTLEIK